MNKEVVLVAPFYPCLLCVYCTKWCDGLGKRPITCRLVVIMNAALTACLFFIQQLHFAYQQ